MYIFLYINYTKNFLFAKKFFNEFKYFYELNF